MNRLGSGVGGLAEGSSVTLMGIFAPGGINVGDMITSVDEQLLARRTRSKSRHGMTVLGGAGDSVLGD